MKYKIEDLYGREFEYSGVVYRITKNNSGSSYLNTTIKENSIILKCIDNGKYKLIESKPEFEYLEEVEVSSSEDFRSFETVLFGCNRPETRHKYDFVCFYKDKYNSVGMWKYARKINHERNKAIKTIKELMKVNNIKIEELCM